jgi:tetratricopeptide (TPR) repeat protein
LYADSLEKAYDRISYHYARTNEAAKAVDYLTRFAEQLVKSYAREEAITVLQEARQHAERLSGEERDRCLLDLVVRQGMITGELGRQPEALELLLQQQTCVERLREPLLAVYYYRALSFTYNRLGDWQRALESAQRALDEAMCCGDEAAQGQAHYLLMMVINFIGQPQQALVHGRQAMPLLEQARDWRSLGEVHDWFAFISVRRGDFEHALQSAGRVGALGQTIGDRNLQVRGGQMRLLTYVTKGEWDAAIAYGQQALELSTGLQQTAWVSAQVGYAHLEQGDVAKAIALLEQTVQHYRRALQTWGWFAAWLGEAYAADGRPDEAYELVRQGLARTREAETHLLEALQTFTEHGFRPEAARTSLDLATVTHAQGNIAATVTHLRNAYALFTDVQAPAYIERTEQLAREYGISLPIMTAISPSS